jgi:hypothetical protein
MIDPNRIISELLVKNPSARLFEPREDLDKAVIGFTTTSVRNNVAIYDRDLLRDALAPSAPDGDLRLN